MFKGWYLLTAFLTFILIFLIGFFAGVSWTTAIWRALGAGTLMGGATFFFLAYLARLLIPAKEIAAASGSVIDIVVPQETPHQSAPAEKEFSPFIPQQINPDLQEIIKEDPLRAAQILEKMGLDL